MNIKKSVFFIVFALFATNVLATVHEFTFKNGLKLLVKEDHRAPVVVSQVWYKVGSSYERPGITGISHALEHMMFKGTRKYPDGEFSEIISVNGGRENAFTGTDYTAYFQTLEKSRLPVSFELEADRMRNLTLPKEEFVKEIEVVKEERRMRTEDNPRAYTREVAMATAFQTSPYRNPIVGWMADLDSMTIEDLEEWYRLWYAPNNATLVVVGDVDPEAVYRLAKKHFSRLRPEKITSPASQPEVPQTGLKRVVVKRPAEVPQLMMLYKTPTLKTAIDSPELVPEWEVYALEVLAGILDGGNSARFASNLVRGKEVASGIGLGYSLVSRLDSTLGISAVPARGKSIKELEQAIREQLEKLKLEAIDLKELERVKAQVVSSKVYEQDSVFYQAMVLGIFETVGLPWQLSEEYVEKVQAVTIEQVQAVAKKYLVDDRLTVAVLEPQPMDAVARQRQARAGGSAHAR